MRKTMKSTTAIAKPIEGEKLERREEKPLVSIVVPAYNEAAIIEKNLSLLCHYMQTLEGEYRWEMIIVNDGSRDETGELAEDFAKDKENVRVLHHIVNFQLGQALRFAFGHCSGDYVITMDVDLSYSPDHIGKMLAKIKETKAKIVIASPYSKGGKVSNVPWLRRTLSIWANRFLSLTARGNLSTLTGMVRAYDARFLRALNLKAMDMSVNAEIIYKAMLLGARIVEVPAHLDWGPQKAEAVGRVSSMKIVSGIVAYILSGFMFRPFMFFLLPGFALMLLSLYPFAWVFIHTFNHLQNVPTLSRAVALAFQQSPHSFFVGGIALMLSIQLITLGILALQSKRYFEELFHLGTAIYKQDQDKSTLY
jgi:glycosyltransferase involved in cell wall biosynthesis